MNSTEKFYALQDKARETLTGDAAALVAEAVLTGQPVDLEKAYSAHCSWRDDETQEEHDELVRVAVEECETLLTELAAARLSKFGLSLDRPTQRDRMKAADEGLMYGGTVLRWVVSNGRDDYKFFESLADVDFYVSYLEDLASMPGN